jgi:transposase
MSLEIFTTHELEEAIVSSCDKNEQLRIQALLFYKNGLNPGKIAKDFSVNRSTVPRWIKRAKKKVCSALNVSLVKL